jgi:excisionase family DNA binding protein
MNISHSDSRLGDSETPTPADATPDGPRLVLSVEAAADMLSISRTRMFALLKSGSVRSVRIGRLRRIPAEALTAYVDQLKQQQCSSRPSTES